MAYTNSPLVSYTKLSPNHSGQRTHSIDRITPHCVVGQATAERIAEIFTPTSREASCNYGIGYDGRISLVVEEKNRSWCSSNRANDQRAITIEVASDSTHPYAFKDAAYAALIQLCIDICKRNGKKKLLWLGGKGSTAKDKAACEDYNPAADEMILTAHRFYANKSCPGDWMYARLGDLAAKVTATLGGETVTTPASGLRQGDSGEAVKTMQTMLIACGYSCGSTGADGDFGKNTLAGLIAFQTAAGLTADGVYGTETKTALEKAYKEKKDNTASNPSGDNEKTIWDTLYAAVGNAYGVAGLMGNLYAESALNPQNLQNNGNKALGMSDAEFTATFDSGAYSTDTFIHDGYGYGLAQWTYYSRKEALVNYARTAGKSIGDLAVQLGFLIQEIKGYKAVWNALTNAKTVREASDKVLTGYECPADQSEKVQEKRAGYGQKYFDKYANATAPATQEQPTSQDACTAEKLIAVAIGELGYKEKASNANLDVKTANAGSANYTKYAHDFDQKYPNWYNGKKNGFAWCDMFCDWCFLTAFGYENALRLTCQPEKSAGAGCTYSLRYYKNKGQFYTSNPKPGDQIFFGTSIDNSSHTGIVEKVDGSKVYTIEGNTSDQVARRSYALNNSRILGYGRPAYDSVSSTPVQPSTPSSDKPYYYRVRKSWSDTNSQIAACVILQNAKNIADLNPGYSVFGEDGKCVYGPAMGTFTPYRVRIKIDDLRIRTGPGTDYSWTGKYTGKGVFTAVAESAGKGSVKGWMKLKSGAGWCSLDYCEKL